MTGSKNTRLRGLFRWAVLGLALALGASGLDALSAVAQEPTPRIEVHFQNYDWVQGTVTPNAWVDITLKDNLGSIKGSYSNWAGDDGWFGSWCVVDAGGGCVDIAPGDTVEVVYDGSDPIIIPVIEITGFVDATANTISGQILADTLPASASVDIWWTRDGAGQEFTTDAAGIYSVDLSPYDVKPGHWVNIWYTNPDGHQVGALFSELRLEVDVTHDNVSGITEPGLTVDLTLRAFDGAVKDMASDVANYEGQFGVELMGDITPGDTVEANANPSTSVYVETITTDVDLDNDTICGTAPANAWLHVGIDNGPWWDLEADGSGNYCADFGGVHDIQPGDDGGVSYESPEGHRISYRFYTPGEPYVRVNQSHNWVEGRTPLPNTLVEVTVTDALGEVKGTYDDWSRGDRWFGSWCPEDVHGNCVDIVAGDTVHVDMAGTLVSVPVIAMTGMVDASTNTITGQILAVPYPADVRGEVWVPDSPSVDGQTDDFGNYTINFSPFDVQEGYYVALWYIRPDGHEVGIVRNALRVGVDISDDNLWGNTAPGATVNITVGDADGIKGTASTIAGAEGDYWSEIYAGDYRVDLLPGDTIDVTAAGNTVTLVVQDPFSAELDADTDTVSGKGSPGTQLRVDVYGYGDKWVTVAPDGNWSVWFGDRGDLQPSDRGDARYYTAEGHEVQVRFYDQFLLVKVNHSHNWVGGETTPGSHIIVTVWRDGLPVMNGTADNGVGTWWYVGFCCGDEYQLQTGDIVEVATSLDLTAMVEIIPITGSVDANANTAYGQLLGVDFPADVRVEVWTEQGTNVDGQTDTSGSFAVDLSPLDLLPGHTVFLSYMRPDGHQVGVIRHALLLDVDTGRDQVNGETAPETSVAVTVNGETATTSSDERGHFDVQFSGDIDVGDTVAATADTQSLTLVVASVEAYIDAEANRVWGYGPPSSGNQDNINVGVNGDWRWTRTDASGYFEITYDRDILADDQLEVEYQYQEGHRARYGFGPADVWVSKWTPVWNIVPGDEFSYIVQYGNGYSGTAADVVIVDTLPDYVTYLWDDSGVLPTYDPVAHTLTWDLGTLGSWQDREFELRVRMEADAPWDQSYRNQVEISAANDRDSGNNQSQTDVYRSDPWADLRVEKELVGGWPVAGGTLTYQLRYWNEGSRPDTNVTLIDTLPEGTTFEGSTFEVGVDGAAEIVGAGEVTWDIGALPPGENRWFEFTVRIAAGTPSGTFLTNEVVIGGDSDPSAGSPNNWRRLSTLVEQPAADLWVDKEIEGDLSSIGNDITYRISFYNEGNVPAEDVSLVDALPAEMVHVWHSAGSAAMLADGTITWNIGTVPPGASGQLLLGAQLGGPVPAGSVMINTIAGMTSTPELDYDNNLAEVSLGPPTVICVPWAGADPHRVWSGLETTLKGTAKGYGLTHYEWDFGDGSPVVSGWVGDPYAIEARHTYVGDPGDTFVATLTVWGAFGWSHSDTYSVQILNRVHGVEKDVAIDEGLWYLHKSAQRYRSGGLPFAEWQRWCCSSVAVNASAIQAFQVQGHGPGGDPLEDPYVEDVQAGWNALFTYAVLDSVTMQTTGNPDGDGDGIGIALYQDYGHSIYEGGLAMMALATTDTPDVLARTGPFGWVRGQTYYDIVQDMADWFAWGQNDPESGWARGGWRYQPNSGDSDNSNTQFPVLGLAAAEENWEITVPDWVKEELRDYWLVYSQNENGAFGYSDPWGMLNVGKTGAGIMDLAWTGVLAEDDRVQRAATYIETHWNDPPNNDSQGGNVGDLYAMYAVKKGSQLASIITYGPYLWDYEYSAYLVGVQETDGHFDEDRNLGVWFGDWQPMSTSWALLILSPGLYEALPVAVISDIQYGMTEPEWYEGQVQFDGTLSYHTDPDRVLVAYEWDFGDGGMGSGATPFHTYTDSGQYIVTLTVWDDEGKSDTDTLLLTVDNLPPDVSANPTEQTVQYSDYINDVTFTATDVPGDSMLVETSWSVDSGAFVSGVPGGLSLAAGVCSVDETTNTCIWTLSGTASVPEGTYTVRVTVADDDEAQTDIDVTITVLPENASVTFSGANSVAVEVEEPGGDSGEFQLLVHVKEALPDTAPHGAAPGEIGLAVVSMDLIPVGPGGSVSGSCIPGPVTGDGYAAMLPVTCTFDEVPVNTYTAQVTVFGGYYTGYSEDVMVVYDPSLGFTTGGGWFYWPGTADTETGYPGDRTNFGFNAKYNKKGQNVQGSLLLIRHLPDGSIYRVKSNVMSGLAVGVSEDPAFGWASFNGKCTYREPDWPEPVGNYQFIVYVEDHDEPGSDVDRFWIEILDRDGNVVNVLSMVRAASDNAETIKGGNIVVPHTNKNRK